MRLPSRQPVDDGPGIAGTARLDRRTSSLVRRLRPGDVAVIDHLDLDRTDAEALLDCGVRAVVNASPFISGRYPNLGPELLANAGVALVDNVGPEVFTRLRDGRPVRVHEGALICDGETVAQGRSLNGHEIALLMEEARSGLATQLQSFAHNTTEFLRREQELLLHGQGMPTLRTRIEGRPVVVVARGYDFHEDLRAMRRYIREQRPVLVGVDAGADALLEAGYRPDVIVIGEHGLANRPGADGVAAVADKTLRAARDVVLHTDRSGHAPGSPRLERLGLRFSSVSASGGTADVAMLVADIAGAALIVAVGTHATLDEFLDRQRDGLASTFLTRLRIGPKLVDARGVTELYAGRVRRWHLAAVLLAGVVALAVALGTTQVGAEWWDASGSALQDLFDQIQGLFT